MARVAVFGALGLLGRALVAEARAAGDEVLALAHADCDIADAASVEAALERFRPEAVYNAAAFTDVDRSESEPALAFRANAEGPGVLARSAARLGARFVHVSSDYVFDGERGEACAEDDSTNPRGAYARSKLEGERLALEAMPRAVVARSAWVYGPSGKSFVAKIPEILRAKGEISAVADQWSSPTRADELARALRALAAKGSGGIYHVAAGGAASYYAVALEAARVLGVDAARVHPTSGAALVRPAPRPRFSALRSIRLEREGIAALRPWVQSYREFAQTFR